MKENQPQSSVSDHALPDPDSRPQPKVGSMYEWVEANPTRSLSPTPNYFYALPPIGVGTPMVESLSSYLARLASAHLVRPSKLGQRRFSL